MQGRFRTEAIRNSMYVFITCSLTSPRSNWGHLNVKQALKKKSTIHVNLWIYQDWLTKWLIWQSKVDAVTSCPSCPNMVNRLNGGLNGERLACRLMRCSACMCSWSWWSFSLHKDWVASILCKKLQHSAFDVMIKKKHAAKTKTLICTCSLCQPGSTLSSPIHPSSSLSPPFSPRWPWLCSSVLLHHWLSLVLSVYRRRGEGAGKRDSAPLTLPLSVYAPTDTQTLSTVRSSSLQQPKKGTRAHRARRQTIETIKKPSQAVSTEEAWNCTTGSVDFFSPPSRA